MNVKFEDNRVIIDAPKKPKKITGTRFGAVLNANKWQTPFQAWCEITKAYAKPYEDTIYTLAGKAIEAKQLAWFEMMLPITRPEDVYGKDFFNKTFGDFFSDRSSVFGGMWDSLVGGKGEYTGVIECKTTKRAEDWENDVPEYYALQAALYAYLLDLDDVYMIVTFLDDGDYEHPEKFEVNADNTTYIKFKVSERYPDFDKYLVYCEEFWDNNVLSGISPEFDEVKDKEYLDALRTQVVDDDNLDAMLEEAEELYKKIEVVKATIKKDEKRLKEIEGLLKKYAIENETDGQTKSVFASSHMTWTVTKVVSKSLDVELMQSKGVYEDYLTEGVSYKITKSVNKGE